MKTQVASTSASTSRRRSTSPARRRTTSTASSKLFYQINEVSKMTGIKAYVLRYWETEFAELAPEKDANGQRRYRDKDIRTIEAIKKLLYQDRFTIKGARPKLKKALREMSAGAPSNGKSAPARQAAPSKLNGKSLGETLFHLRKEVNDLLKYLNA